MVEKVYRLRTFLSTVVILMALKYKQQHYMCVLSVRLLALRAGRAHESSAHSACEDFCCFIGLEWLKCQNSQSFRSYVKVNN